MMTERKNVVTFKGTPITLLGEEVKVGDKAKDFTVLANDLKEVKLSDYKGKVVIISVFHEFVLSRLQDLIRKRLNFLKIFSY